MIVNNLSASKDQKKLKQVQNLLKSESQKLHKLQTDISEREKALEKLNKE